MQHYCVCACLAVSVGQIEATKIDELCEDTVGPRLSKKWLLIVGSKYYQTQSILQVNQNFIGYIGVSFYLAIKKIPRMTTFFKRSKSFPSTTFAPPFAYQKSITTITVKKTGSTTQSFSPFLKTKGGQGSLSSCHYTVIFYSLYQ